MTIDTTVINDEDKIRIRNLTRNIVVYITPSTGIRREIAAQGSIYVSAGELRECSYDTGCSNMFHDYIQICNPTLAEELGVSSDIIEYNWKVDDIKEVLLSTDDNDYNRFLDALDFAPAGIRQNIVDMAVELEVPDMRRREAIKQAMNVDITRMIENKHAMQADSEEESKQKTTKRRASSSSTSGTTKKRRSTAKPTVTEEVSATKDAKE